MINWIHSQFHRPEKGWDPIPNAYAEEYARKSWEGFDQFLVDELDQKVGGLKGKRILDLGGGPGQYSVAFAKKGAVVTWHDISSNYLEITRRYADEAGVEIDFSLGYLEEADRLVQEPFDIVFNRICWYYCMNDWQFAKLLYSLIAPGGVGYIIASNTKFRQDIKLKRVRYFLNNYLGWKIGHPHPPRGRVAKYLQRFPIETMCLDYSSDTNDRIYFRKANL